MAKTRDSNPINALNRLPKRVPSTKAIFAMLLVISAITGLSSVLLAEYSYVGKTVLSITTAGLLAGILTVMLPTLLTAIAIKLLERHVYLRHILLISTVGATVYAVFIMLSSAVYQIVGNYYLSNAIVLAGDVSIFAIWLFAGKIMFGQKKRAAIFSMVQPAINILIYTAASRFIFTFRIPLTLLFIKFAAGIVVFAVISYFILYIFDSPVKRSFGFGGVDLLAQTTQNWLFDIDTHTPFGSDSFGVDDDIETHTFVFKNAKGGMKCILYAPWLHYGPMGTIGGSNFPYQLERHGYARYNVPVLVMHPAVNEAFNPVSSSQIDVLREALDRSVKESRPVPGRKGAANFTRGASGAATVTVLDFNGVAISTLTRAPRVTEDVKAGVKDIFEEMLRKKGIQPLIIDAHNSRYESAPEEELDGVKLNSKAMDEYVEAIRLLGEPQHRSKALKVGASSTEIYDALSAPEDLAPGRLNAVVFGFNGFKYAMLQFNSNNMHPRLRDAIRGHVKRRFGVECEAYTTDTHFVNSMVNTPSNVLGRHTKLAALLPFIDMVMEEAMADLEPAEVHYNRGTIRNFTVWGPDLIEKGFAIINSVISIAKVLVPASIVAGFVIASWLIFLV